MLRLKLSGKALLEQIRQEIDALVAEAQALLPREKSTCVGAIYARCSTRFQHKDPAFGTPPLSTILQDVLSLLVYFAFIRLLVV